MNTEPAAHSSNCPECGQDPAITRQQPMGVSYRAAYIAAGLWSLAVLLTLAYSLPWTQAKIGNPLAIYSSTNLGQPEYSTALTPAVSVADLRDHKQAAEKINNALDPLRIKHGRWWADAQIRFVLTDRSGMRYDQRYRGFGGVWISEYANTHLTDVTHEPTGNGPWNYPIEAIDSGVFDGRARLDTDWLGLRTETTRLSGGQWYRRSINPVWFLVSIVSVALVLHITIRLLRRVLRRWNRIPEMRPLVAWCLIGAFLIGVVALGYQRTLEYHHIAGMDISQSDPERLGPWIGSDEFELLLLGPDRGQAILDHLLALCENHPDHLIIGYQTKRESVTEFHQLNAQLGHNAELMSFGSMRFLSETPDDSLVPAKRPGYLKPGFSLDHAKNWEAIWIGHNSALVSWYVSIYWTRLIFVGFLAWVLLRVSLRIARIFVYRTQRQRVRRDQCIFCAYPLSENALNLRHSSAVSNELSS